METALVIVVAVLLLGGGGWGYSRLSAGPVGGVAPANAGLYGIVGLLVWLIVVYALVHLLLRVI